MVYILISDHRWTDIDCIWVWWLVMDRIDWGSCQLSVLLVLVWLVFNGTGWGSCQLSVLVVVWLLMNGIGWRSCQLSVLLVVVKLRCCCQTDLNCSAYNRKSLEFSGTHQLVVSADYMSVDWVKNKYCNKSEAVVCAFKVSYPKKTK